MTENWKPIPGYEGLYEVSDMGRVMNIDTGRILKQSLTGNNRCYRTVKLSRKSHLVHYLVLLGFISDRPDGLVINHKNGIKTDNRLENLEYCTQLQNIRHAIEQNLYRQKRLTEADLRAIRDRYAAGDISCAALGRLYNVTGVTISRAVGRIGRKPKVA